MPTALLLYLSATITIGVGIHIAQQHLIIRVLYRLESALTEEGFKSSETALDTGFLPIFERLRKRFSFLKFYPNGRVPKF